MEQIVDSRVVGGGLQDFRPVQSSSSSSHVPARGHEALQMSLVKVFFALCPKTEEKCEVGSALESESPRQCQLIHAGSSAASRCLGRGPRW